MASSRLARFQIRLWLAGAVLCVVAPCGWFGWQWWDCLPTGLTPHYVGRETCAACHQAENEKWQGSHHALAMDHARPDSVLGDFNDVSFEHGKVTAKFYQKLGRYFVDTQGPRGQLGSFEVKYTFGVEPLQQYLVEFADGRVQTLPFGWDVSNRRWFYVPDDENIRPEEPIYWTNRGMNWNFMCADCHSTNLQKNYDRKTNRYATTWTDINVSCEACHGPGSIHVAIASRRRRMEDRRYGTGLPRLKSPGRSLPVAGATSAWREDEVGTTLMDTCGRCHARRRVYRPGFEPGQRLLDHFLPELLDSEAYYADGQIREENYEYGSFAMSLMYAKGVRCSDCHDPHSAKLLAQGNTLCTRCHLAAKYDAIGHHFHMPGGKGAACVACHMSETTYMRIDARHDHSFRVPRPDLSVSLGIPNACDRCHREKSAQWAQDEIVKWHGAKQPSRRQDVAKTIAGGRATKAEARDGLIRLARDESLAPFLRASGLALLQRYPQDAQLEDLMQSMSQHHEPLLRIESVRGLAPAISLETQSLPADAPARPINPITRLLAQRLNDPNAAVRHESGRLLLGDAATELDDNVRIRMHAVLDDYRSGLEFLSDDPGANLALGILEETHQHSQAAEGWYRRAIELDESYTPARFNLGLLLHSGEKRTEAIVVFEELIEWLNREIEWLGPSAGVESRSRLAQAHYQLGLVLGEDRGAVGQAAFRFEKALELEPNRIRIRYNLGLAYQQLQRWNEAERELQAAYRTSPTNDDFAYALAYFYFCRDRPDVARQLLSALLARNPDHRDAASLLREISMRQR